eukprot:TRINITY_DN1782_c2_g1_i1.p1 TRINITY_DN1782_c2_g1~~TRINITY_DN1782_c2_g1_i1.p1  ORF type:complete len:1680 (+),score=402.64 TRINITY_DN1782_c2_g1_i1:372-5042(+)
MFGDTAEHTEIGLIPRITHKIFNDIEKQKSSLVKFEVKASYMEIYNERVRCLLNPSLDGGSLKVREHPETGPYVEGLTEMSVGSHQEVFRVMHDGNKLRTTAATNMNTHSSRSHALFQLTVTQEILMEGSNETLSSKTARLNLVDLAGSERISKTQATGTRLLEGSNINKSLTTLGQVISALAETSSTSKRHIPYRDSILTWVLKDNLGGNSKTMMIATVSPASDNYDETMSTLRYAERAKKIVNKAVINEDANSALVLALKDEISRLQNQLQNQDGNKKELEQNKLLMNQLQMSWGEKLDHARELAAKKGDEVANAIQQKQHLQAEVDGLMLERSKQSAELAELQQQLQQKDTEVESIITKMKQREAEFEAKIRQIQTTPGTTSKTEETELQQLRQQMAVMSAEMDAHRRKREEEDQKSKEVPLDQQLSYKVVALLETLHVPSISHREKELMSHLTVKDMAMVYDQLGEGIDNTDVWSALLIRLEDREGKLIPETEEDTIRTNTAATAAALVVDPVDELEPASPTRGRGVGGHQELLIQSTVDDSPSPGNDASPTMPSRHSSDDEGDLLDELLSDQEDETTDKNTESNKREEADRLLDEILGDDDEDAKSGDAIDDMLDELVGSDDEKDELDNLLEDGSSEADHSEKDALDELLGSDDDEEPARPPNDQPVAGAVDIDHTTGYESDDESDDILGALLGDNLESHQDDDVVAVSKPAPVTTQTPTPKAETSYPTETRLQIWNTILFNMPMKLAKEGDAFILQHLKETESDPQYAKKLASSVGGAVPGTPFGDGDSETRLTNFYAFYNKKRISTIPEIIKKFSTVKDHCVITSCCNMYQGAEPPLLSQPPKDGIKTLKDGHWFWGPVLSGRGPPPFIDNEGFSEAKHHPLEGSPRAVRKEGPATDRTYWEDRLRRFFNHYQQRRKPENIKQLLDNFAGIENQLFQALVARYGPEPVQGQKASPRVGKKSKDNNYGSTNNPIRIDISSVEGHGALLSGFKVLKINPSNPKSAKNRVWVIDFFKRQFSNLSSGRATQVYPCNHLFRIEKLYTHNKQLRLSFYKAPHPYVLQFGSAEARQRFFELAWATRRHICWLPDLVPKSHNAISVNLMGTSKKHKEISGVANLHLTRDPIEMLTVWSCSMSLGGRVLSLSDPKSLNSLLPRPSKYDMHFICFTELPELYQSSPYELVKFFKTYCEGFDLHPFLSTNLGGSKAVVIALARKRHISKVGNMEAIELRDSNTSVVGLFMRYGESTIALIMANLNPGLTTSQKNHKIATIMRKVDIGDLRLEFSHRFDFVIWLGTLGYGGTPHEPTDELLNEISVGNVMSHFTEPSVSKQETFKSTSIRCFVKAARPSSFHPITYTTSPVCGRPATIFATALSTYRPYLGSLVQNKPRPTNYFFVGLTLKVIHAEVVTHLAKSLTLTIMSQYMEGSSINVEMSWDESKKAYVAKEEECTAPAHMITNTEEFLKRQFMSFSIRTKAPKGVAFPYTAWATGVLSLKHYTGNKLSHFQCSVMRTALKVGTLSGSTIRLPIGQSLSATLKASKHKHIDPLSTAI